MEDCHSSIDLQKLKQLYDEVSINVSDVHKSFSDLVDYHNKMLFEKSKFIEKELNPLNVKLDTEKYNLEDLLEQEKILSKKIAKSDTFEDLEEIIIELNSKYKEKGEYDIVISQLDDTDKNIDKLEIEIEEIESVQFFSSNFEELLKLQITKFNKLFSNISYELYGEKYALKYDKEINKKSGKLLYKFNAFNLNMSTGKKQGEILCYDLAYILFAEQEEIPCFYFLLNDKKELMHINQLTKVAKFVKDKKIQLVVSILNDKLTEEVKNNAHIAVSLSQEEKLFKIE